MMRLAEAFRKRYDYVAVFCLGLIIFGKSLFSSIMVLDYTISPFPYLLKEAALSGYNGYYAFTALRLPFELLGIQACFFQAAVIGLMVVSYHYIKKLTNYPLMFSLIYFFSPFLYLRIMAGHIGIVVSYLLVPVYLHYLFSWLKAGGSAGMALRAAIAFTLPGIFAPHFFAIDLLILAMGLLFFRKSFQTARAMAWSTAIFISAVILLNSFWLQGFFQREIFSEIDSSHLEFFSPKASAGINALTKTASTHGFWRESGYATSYTGMPYYLWLAALAVIIYLMFRGFLETAKNPKSRLFIALWWLGIFLAAGVSHPYFQNIFAFLAGSMPFFSGFRDSHKFTALIALAYAYLCPVAIDRLAGSIARLRIAKSYSKLGFAFIIVAFNYPMLGLWGQLGSVSYPESYEAASDFIGALDARGHIVYFPFYDYLTYTWSSGAGPDGRLANPINRVIRDDVVTNPGPWGARSSLVEGIGSCIAEKSTPCLEGLGIEYIIYDSCFIGSTSAWQEYSFVESGEKLYAKGCISVYRLASPGADKEIASPPARLWLGICISIASLAGIAYLIKSGKA